MRQNNMRFFVAALFCMLFVLTGCGGQTQKTAAESAPGFVKAMTPEERADAILARMTPAEKIGQLFGGRKHTTVMHGCDNVDEDSDLKKQAEEIYKLIT